MASEERFHHLFLSEKHRKVSDYTRQPTNRNDKEKAMRDRPSHAARIEQHLSAAWNDALESRQAVGSTTPHGLYLEFEVDKGFEVPVSTLDVRSKGVELRNIREVGTGNQQRSLATVFVPADHRSYFLKQVQEYASQDTKGGKPKREKFVASLDDIRAAVLESFWTHDVKELPTDDPEWVEIWLHDSNTNLGTEEGAESEVVEQFRVLLAELGIIEQAERSILKFPERAVVLINANRAQLAALVASSDALAEIRPAAELASFFIEALTRDEQAEFIEDLVGRMKVSEDCEIAVCILDGGVNWGHPLLKPILKEEIAMR